MEAEDTGRGVAGESFTITVRRSTVRGTVWGAEGPVVYLVHGWGGVAEQLDAFVEPLLASGHRVVSLTPPAMGSRRRVLRGRGARRSRSSQRLCPVLWTASAKRMR